MKKYNIEEVILKRLPAGLALLTILLIITVTLHPDLDMRISGWFFQYGANFYLAERPGLIFLHFVGTYGAWALCLFLLYATLYSWHYKQAFLHLDMKSWLFLLLALLIGPGLIANVGFKDHWGRARPREVGDFGGNYAFTPVLSPQIVEHKNGSFVAGDPSFGFYLSSFGYVATRKRTRRVFWLGMTAGLAFGFARLAMGAHFISDILYAEVIMVLTCAIVHATMYTTETTLSYWREWFKFRFKS